MKIYLSAEFKQAWQGKDPFAEVEKLQGEVFRELESRRTLRFSLSDSKMSDSFLPGFLLPEKVSAGFLLPKAEQKTYFVKIHRGVGWFEIIENLLRLRLPVLGAGDEYRAIKKLESLHIDTMRIVGYAEKGFNPATRQSFIITEDLVNTISLEDYCEQWPQKKPDPVLKRALIEKLAGISQTLHNNGLNHRDYYICHFLLDLDHLLELDPNLDPGDADGEAQAQNLLTAENIKLFLIDLHRGQIRDKTPLRWRVKDIASLYFSVMHLGLNKKDFFRFMRYYDQTSLRESLTSNKTFWSRVELQGQKLWRRKLRKGDAI
jgi:heptose I phosphotransferase